MCLIRNRCRHINQAFREVNGIRIPRKESTGSKTVPDGYLLGCHIYRLIDQSRKVQSCDHGVGVIPLGVPHCQFHLRLQWLEYRNVGQLQDVSRVWQESIYKYLSPRAFFRQFKRHVGFVTVHKHSPRFCTLCSCRNGSSTLMTYSKNGSERIHPLSDRPIAHGLGTDATTSLGGLWLW